MSDSLGRFVWYELMTTDTEGAKSFYTRVIGWDTQSFEGPMDYTMWVSPGGPIGGLAELPAEARAMGAGPHWLPYVGTPDVDATVAKAGSLGARTLVPPMDIPGTGRFAILQDPQGAAFAVFASAQPGGSPATGPGTYSWHELITTDHVAAFAFYSTLFDWQKTSAMDMGPMGTYQMYGQGGKSYGGMFDKSSDMPAPPHWLCYVDVADVHAAAEKAKSLGGQVLNGPMEVPGGGWIVQCMDPQGAVFAMYTEKKA